ncbi:MAG: hypothetical protein ACQES2_00745 [Pseudomonadota bacterium]
MKIYMIGGAIIAALTFTTAKLIQANSQLETQLEQKAAELEAEQVIHRLELDARDAALTAAAASKAAAEKRLTKLDNAFKEAKRHDTPSAQCLGLPVPQPVIDSLPR